MKTTLAACCLVDLVLASSVLKAQGFLAAAEVARLAGTWELDTSGDPSLQAERRIITVSAASLQVEIVRAEDARPPRLTIDSMARTRWLSSGPAKPPLAWYVSAPQLSRKPSTRSTIHR